MIRLLTFSLVLVGLLSTGCCHCYQRSYYPGHGPIAQAVAAPVRGLVGCSKGCGDVYWGEWTSDPPDECDPCCGNNFVGPRDCCGGRPHTRLCIVGILQSLGGIRGTCGHGVYVDRCCSSCGVRGCAGGCAGGCGGGDENWDEGGATAYEGDYVGEYSGEYSAEMSTEYAGTTSPQMTPVAGRYPQNSSVPVMRSTPGTYNHPAWNRVPSQPPPGVPSSTGRRPSGTRSAQLRSNRPGVRAVSYEEDAEETAAEAETNGETAVEVEEKSSLTGKPPKVLEEVLPDPRGNYRR